MELIKLNARKLTFPFVIISSGILLFLTSRENYLLFHTLAEVVTVIIAFGIFVIAWSSRRYIENNFLLVLGIGSFFVGSFDLIHTLAYQGMQIFSSFGVDETTKFWLLARYTEAFTFLGALVFLKKGIRRNRSVSHSKPAWIFLGYLGFFIFSVWAVHYGQIYPVAFVEGQGMTFAKKLSEYVLSAAFIYAIYLLFRKKKMLDLKMVNLLSMSLVMKAAAEISFTSYVGVYDFSNMLGHLFKFFSFLLLYKAVLEIGLMRPYNFLFLDLKKSQDEYRMAQNELQERIEEQLGDAYQHLGLANRKISLLLEIEKNSHKKSNKHQIIAYILELAKKAAHAQVVLLYSYDGGNIFSLIRGKDQSEKNPKLIRTVRLDQAAFLKSIIVDQKRMNAVCEEKNIGCFFDSLKMNYFVALPLKTEKSCGGFMLLGFEKRKSMETQELEFLDIFSIHASNALYRLKVIK